MSPDDLHRSILERPDDTALRLRWAHAVEAVDPERAELVRIQCRDTPQDGDRIREAELLDRRGEGWQGRLAEWTCGATFRRGFVESVGVELEVLPERAAAMFAEAPIRELRLDGEVERDPGLLRRVAALPELARLRRLDLQEAIMGDAGMRVLLASPHLSGLEELVISDADATVAVAGAIADAAPEALRTLTFVGLISASLGDDGARRIAGSPRLSRLEELSLLNCDLGADGMRALTASRHLGGLRALDLGLGQYTLNHIGPEGAEALAGSPNSEGLERLNLAFNALGDEGVAHLAHSPVLRRLRHLSLATNAFGDAAFRALARSAALASVRCLDVGQNRVTANGLDDLVRADPAGLRTLRLAGNPLGDAAVRLLDGSSLLRRLEELSLARVGITDDGAAMILASPDFGRLRLLHLGLNELGPEQSARLRARFGERIRC